MSIVSWYDKTNLLLEQTSVTTATLTIQRASCTDTKNFTLVASNGIGTAAKAMVELIVNCAYCWNSNYKIKYIKFIYVCVYMYVCVRNGRTVGTAHISQGGGKYLCLQGKKCTTNY